MKQASRATLGDVADFINGLAFKPEDWETTGYKIIRIQNLTDKAKPYNLTNRKIDSKFIVNPGDLLVSWSATLGVFQWDDEESAVLNQHIFRVIPDEKKVYKPFLKFALDQSVSTMDRHTHGATMKHINRAEFLNTPIHLPPLPEQKRIAAILDKADAIRRKRQQAVKLTEELLRSVFLDMFGDPVTNPKRWEKVTIRDLVSEVKYGTSEKASYEGKYPILRMNNITYKGGWDFTDLKRINLPEKELSKYLVQKGDILFNRTNSKELVGKTAVYRQDSPMVYAGYLIRVSPNQQNCSEYIAAYLNSAHGKKTLENMCKNIVGMANINAQELQEIPILKPPLDLQEQYNVTVQSVEAAKIKFQQAAYTSDTLFTSLLKRAFRGGL